MKSKSDTSDVNTKMAWRYAGVFLLSAFILLIFTPLFQKGTFIDGMLYKAVAFNASVGVGFWQMKFTDTSMPTFCEQPPLYFYVLGWFYKVLGSHYLVDRLFTLLLFMAFMIIANGVIKTLIKQSSYFFLFFFFYMLSVPVYCWSYVNQVIEPLVCVFTVFAIYAFVKYTTSEKAIYILYFGLSLILLFLSKGFQSCFIIMLPLAYTLLKRYERKSFRFLLISSILFLSLIVSLLKYYTPAKQWFDCYYNTRLVLTMQNVGNTTDSHVEIIVRFFTELIICLLFVLLLVLKLKFKNKYPLQLVWKNFYKNKLALALLLTSLAGSFPYAISLVQRGFYLLPAFVCFLLAILIGWQRYWLTAAHMLNVVFKAKVTRALIALIAIATLSYTFLSIKDYKRDAGLVSDLDKLAPYLKNEKRLQIEGSMWNYFSLHAYLYMSHHCSLSLANDGAHYYLIEKGQQPATEIGPCTKIETGTEGLDLYELK